MNRIIGILLCCALLCGACTGCMSRTHIEESPKTDIPLDTPEDGTSPDGSGSEGVGSEMIPSEEDTGSVEEDPFADIVVEGIVMPPAEELSLEEQDALLAELRNIISLTGAMKTCYDNCVISHVHTDSDRMDCVSSDVAREIELETSLDELYAKIGKPHWYDDTLIGASGVTAPTKYYYLLSNGLLLSLQCSVKYQIVISVDYCHSDTIIDNILYFTYGHRKDTTCFCAFCQGNLS